MKKLLFYCFLLISTHLYAQTGLSEEARISLLTSSPSDDEVFTLYGHTALRVLDPANKIDLVYNYGIFDFSKPNFIYRFAKGETDYKLAAFYFDSYLAEYQLRGSRVTEQVLNLTYAEKVNIWEALETNIRPENRVYRYNFFYDNCSTRPAVMIENALHGNVGYHHAEHPKTFRDMINYCTRNHPWQTFGCDIALGSPTDRIVTQREEMFLPDYLMDAFAEATITSPDGSVRPLVSQTNILTEEDKTQQVETTFFTPLLCGWVLFMGVVLLTWREWKKKGWFRWLDFLLFAIAGIAGCVLWFLVFVSEHPCTAPNWLIGWLHPFQLIGAILFVVKKWQKGAYYYHFINFAALTLLLVGWYFIPQHLNAAFFPLMGIYWLRSVVGIYRYKKSIE